MTWNENANTIKKSQSPNSIYFYLKKYNNNMEIAKVELEKYRDKNRGKLKRKSDPSYWQRIGHSQEESIKLSQEWMYAHNRRVAKIPKRKNAYKTEIKNLQHKHNISEVEAMSIAASRRKKHSPRVTEYWKSRGWTEEEAKEKVSKFQAINSPRTIYYWISRGKTEEEAIDLVSKYQDHISIDSIRKRIGCSREEAWDIQREYINKARLSISDLDDEIYGLFLLYKHKVGKITHRTYAIYKDKIDPKNLRGDDYHLDHIVSIKDGFVSDVPAAIIGSRHNLQIVTQHFNCSKKENSNQTIEQLIRKCQADEDKINS
jgi:hypothetical protein